MGQSLSRLDQTSPEKAHPTHDTQHLTLKPPPSQDTPPPGDILVVDDTLPNLRLLTSLLQEQGYNTRGVSTGGMALTVVQTAPPDLILLDVNMPGLDGYEVCRRLKSDPQTRDIPILFISALDETADKVRGFAVGAIDYITKPFQVEEVLARVQTHLDLHRLQQINQAQIQALEQSNAELDAFAHTVAHDLKNPLTNVQLYADILRRRLATYEDPQVQRGLNHLFENALRMGQIIEALLLLAGVRNQPVELKPLQMGEIVAQAVWRLQAQARAVEAEIYMPQDWPTAVGYAPWIEEVWYNYLSNGLKYGGRPCHLELGGTSLPDPINGQPQARFWVRDNGPGIDPQIADTLFEEFTQLTPAQRDSYGLGLSIVRRITHRLGGVVGHEDTSGEGTVFYFTLPEAGERTP